MLYEISTTRPNVNRKRSVVVSNRRTSVSLEDSFWVSLQAIVKMENTTIENYIETIERRRDTPNLSSNLRIAVLEYYQQLAARSMVAALPEEHSPSVVPKPVDRHSQLAEKVAAYWDRIGNDKQLAD